MASTDHAQELRQLLTLWREAELRSMTRTQRAEQFPKDVETDDFVRCAWVLVRAFGQAHHVPLVKFGILWLEVPYSGNLATSDGDLLTRLVVAAHDAAVRLSINPGGPRRVVLVLHPRVRSGRMGTNHLPLEEANQRLQDLWVPCPVVVPKES